MYYVLGFVLGNRLYYNGNKDAGFWIVKKFNSILKAKDCIEYNIMLKPAMYEDYIKVHALYVYDEKNNLIHRADEVSGWNTPAPEDLENPIFNALLRSWDVPAPGSNPVPPDTLDPRS